ncbi:hypothetical protein [Halorussus litoreus]|uniref:hypothetical protein n=1 Tax=Halorussus litoreus TaxID=1710536 RepID=UPI000E27289E|nr:hypothetical protein [Halorussus litoreus]
MQRLALVLIAVLVTASLAPAAAGDPLQSSDDSYAGTHVSFGVDDRALTDYAVGGETVLDSLAVESERSVAADGLVDANASLSTVTDLDGAPLAGTTVDANATPGAAVTDSAARFVAGSSATIAAHDNRRGVLVVASGNASNYAVADLPADANASADGDSQIEFTTANGTEATLLVVGDGTVTVNEEGGVTARLGGDGRLVVRAYPDQKVDADETRERLITEGAATAEVYVTAANGSSVGETSENATATEQVTVDTVTYADGVAVETAGTSESQLSLAVNRTTSEGTILLTSVSEELLDTPDGVEVAVDGTAAAEAATYSQLESAVGSGQSRYLVGKAADGDAQADAATEVAVAVNHFSERTVSIRGLATDGMTTPGGNTTALTTDSDADESTTLDEWTASGETTTAGATEPAGEPKTTADNSSGIPGFSPITAVVALLAAAVLCGAVAVRSS